MDPLAKVQVDLVKDLVGQEDPLDKVLVDQEDHLQGVQDQVQINLIQL